MPSTTVTLTPDDVLNWLCDQLPPAEQRRLLLGLTLDAEVVLASQGCRGQAGSRTLHLSNGTGQVLVFSIRPEIEGPAALDAFRTALDDGSLTVRPALWHDPEEVDGQIRRGALCLSGGRTLATVAVDEETVAFTIARPSFDRVGTVPDLIASAGRGTRTRKGQSVGRNRKTRSTH